MNTEDVLVYTAVAQAGSLSEAARRLGIAPMLASRRLAALEAALGVRLMHRTTRSLSLTPEGEAFMPFAQALVENAEQAMARLRAGDEGAAGLLRVSVSVAFGRKIVAPLIPRLLEANPQLRIALDMSDALPDLVATGTDLAIRNANLRDSSLIVQKLAENARYLVATPAYLARRGRPARLADLGAHDCIPRTGTTHWSFRASGEERSLRLNPRFTSSSIEGCHAACMADGGIAMLSEWNIREDLESGRLAHVQLSDAEPEALTISAVYPTTRLVLPKVRVFIAALRQALAEARIGTSG